MTEAAKETQKAIDIVIGHKWSRESCVDSSLTDKLDKWMCSICLDICYPMVETPCGHVFCENCIKRYLQTRKLCPIDNLPLHTHQLHVSEFNRREIAQLPANCPFAEYGCKWKGELSQIEHHIMYKKSWVVEESKRTSSSSSLLQTLLPRSKESKNKDSMVKFKGPCCEVISSKCPHCGESVRKDILDMHLAKTCKFMPVTCDCGQSVPKEQWSQHRSNLCPSRLIPCPNGCLSMIKKSDTTQHIYVNCPSQIVECPFAESCGQCRLMIRSSLEKHLSEANVQHLLSLQNALRHLQSKTQDKKLEENVWRQGSIVKISPLALSFKFEHVVEHPLAQELLSEYGCLDAVYKLQTMPCEKWPQAIILRNVASRYQVQLISSSTSVPWSLWFHENDMILITDGDAQKV